MAKRNIIVIGATGKQGRAFIHALLSPSSDGDTNNEAYHVWAITRQPFSPSAAGILEAEKDHEKNITIVGGDVNDAGRMKEIFTQVSTADGAIFGVFVVLAYPGLGNKSDEEIKQGKMLADLAFEFKVEAFVYSSAIQPGPDQDDVHDASHKAKREIELYGKQLGDKGLNWIIVRPGFFMENFDGFVGSLAVSMLSNGLRKETNIALVATEDIGKVSAGVFQNHKRYLHKTLSITGGCLTMNEITAAYKDATGKQMPSTPSFFSNLLLRFSTGAQHVVKEIERNHDVRANGEYPEFDSEVELAKSACELQDYRTWITRRTQKGAE
ncbi:hypothetical protein PT974_03345 [Cladobotryum mycophilum]|uniref:NmrA-like domain-containing protein n=1 Tax=Cladobotryum mycophilum TaxID=491253 RepID=A0ABR0ST91_9HYPO